MKLITVTSVSCMLILMTVISSSAQKHKKDDESITITINGKTTDLDEYMEDWGDRLEEKIENEIEDLNISVNISDEDFELDLNNISIHVDNVMESLGNAIAEMVTHMNIELKNIDPDDLDDNDIEFNDENISDLIREIEKKNKSKVSNIDMMNIRIREGYTNVDMEVTLENGKRKSVSRKYINDN